MKALCGPKFLRNIEEPCDGVCCGLGKDGTPDPELTERANRRADGWRRILGGDKSQRSSPHDYAQEFAGMPFAPHCSARIKLASLSGQRIL
jgi:hypothetical protein